MHKQVIDLRARVLVLDNTGQTYGGNENDRHQVTMFVNGVFGRVRGREFAPVILGHVARSPASEFFIALPGRTPAGCAGAWAPRSRTRNPATMSPSIPES
jgi:hypothetical protein